jgi:hypothetical protein
MDVEIACQWRAWPKKMHAQSNSAVNSSSKHNVSSETSKRAVKLFGKRDLEDLVDVMGPHAREATLLTAFDQQLPAGPKPLLPVP